MATTLKIVRQDGYVEVSIDGTLRLTSAQAANLALELLEVATHFALPVMASVKELRERLSRYGFSEAADTCNACGGSGLWHPPAVERPSAFGAPRTRSCSSCDGTGKRDGSNQQKGSEG